MAGPNQRLKPGKRLGPGSRLSTLGFNTDPIITGVSPNSSRLADGITITITGDYFRLETNGSVPVVTVGGNPATGVVVVSRTQLTAVVPVGVAGLVDVTVIQGSQRATLSSAFTYYAASIASLSPSYGPTLGGDLVTIFGYNFLAGASVLFGSNPATDITFIDDQHYSVVVPAGSGGFVDVSIIDTSGTTTLRGGWQYVELLRNATDATLILAIRRDPSISISSGLGQPKNAKFRIGAESQIPVLSERFRIIDEDDNSRILFAGILEDTDLGYDDAIEAYFWECVCSGWTVLFNKYHPIISFDNVPADDAVIALVTEWAPGFTTNHVQRNLAPVTITFDGTSDMSSCLREIARLIGGGHDWIDDDQDVHFMHVLPSNIPPLPFPQTSMRVGPASAPVLAEASADYPDNFVPCYAALACSFVYDNSTESAIGPLGSFVATQGDRRWSVSSIAIGAASGTHACVARRLYYRIFNSSGVASPLTRYLEVPDNVTTNLIAHGLIPRISDLAGSLVFVDPPNVGTVEGVGFRLDSTGPYSSGFNVGDPIIAKFTAVNSNGETTLGAGVTFNVTSDRPGTILTPRFVAPSTLPVGASSFNSWLSVDGGVTFHQGDSRLKPSQPIYITYFTNTTTTKDWISSLPLAPTVNTAVIDGSVLTPSWQTQVVPYVAPPAGPTSKPDIIAGTGMMLQPPSPPFTRGVKSPHTFTPGYYRIRYSWLYANGVISLPSPASEALSMDGTHPFILTNLTAGSNVAGIPVVGTIIWVDYVGISPIQFPLGKNLKGAFEPGNTGSTLTTQASMGIPIKMPAGVTTATTPVWPNPDGPNLETEIPDPIDDNNLDLLREGSGDPVKVREERTQVWNRVKIFGSGSSLTSDLLIGSPTAEVADLTKYDVSGGSVIAAGQQFNYVGVSAPEGAGTLLLDSSTPLTKTIPSGTSVLNFFQADDVASQKAIAAVERDKDNNPTDGVYETVISDHNLTSSLQLFMKAYALLERYAWPVKTISYSTRGYTHPGQTVHVDLSHPPVKGDFLIQTVTVDQIHETTGLAPRYTISASSVKFDIEDFLFALLDRISQSDKSSPLVGVVSAAVGQAVEQIPSSIIIVKTGTFTDAQVRNFGTTPVTVVAGVPGSVIIPIMAYFRSNVTVTGGSFAPRVRYVGHTTNLGLGTINWTNSTDSEQTFALTGGDGTNNFGAVSRLAGLGLTVDHGNPGSVTGTWIYSIMYYLVTPSI